MARGQAVAPPPCGRPAQTAGAVSSSPYQEMPWGERGWPGGVLCTPAPVLSTLAARTHPSLHPWAPSPHLPVARKTRAREGSTVQLFLV